MASAAGNPVLRQPDTQQRHPSGAGERERRCKRSCSGEPFRNADWPLCLRRRRFTEHHCGYLAGPDKDGAHTSWPIPWTPTIWAKVCLGVTPMHVHSLPAADSATACHRIRPLPPDQALSRWITVRDERDQGRQEPLMPVQDTRGPDFTSLQPLPPPGAANSITRPTATA